MFLNRCPFLILATLVAGCNPAPADPEGTPAARHIMPVLAGRLENRDIDEASGIVRSQRSDNLFWVINDSGKARLHPIDNRGRRLGRVKVDDAKLSDWEDKRRTVSDELQQLRLTTVETEHRFARLEERLREDTGVELRRCLGEIEGLGLEMMPDEFVGPPAPQGAVEELQGPPLPPAVVADWYSMRRLWLEEEFEPTEAKKEVKVLRYQRRRRSLMQGLSFVLMGMGQLFAGRTLRGVVFLTAFCLVLLKFLF